MGKDNEFRDFYIWRKPKFDADGKRQPPNNWGAMWGGTYLPESLDTISSHTMIQEVHGSMMKPQKSTTCICLLLSNQISTGKIQRFEVLFMTLCDFG